MAVLHYVPSPASAAPPAASAMSSASAAASAPSNGPTLWSHGSFGFKDLLDIVNPLQHLPVVGSIYRYLTGDEPSGGARIIGDTIFGGPIGFGVGVVGAALTDSKGHDLGERALAAVFGPRDATPSSDGPTLGTPTVATTVGGALPPARAGSVQTASAPGQPVGMRSTPPNMSGLFRSAPAAAAAATPEQTFMAQTAQLQRQASNGQTLNSRVVPLELGSALLPASRPIPRPTAPPPSPADTSSTAPASSSAGSSPALAAPDPAAANGAPNPIAQKMLDALTKYQQLKTSEKQDDSSSEPAPSKVDLSL
jgi:hypothetical protein